MIFFFFNLIQLFHGNKIYPASQLRALCNADVIAILRN